MTMQCSPRADLRNMDKLLEIKLGRSISLMSQDIRFARILALLRPNGKNLAGFAAPTER
jgi:hypothetical protein